MGLTVGTWPPLVRPIISLDDSRDSTEAMTRSLVFTGGGSRKSEREKTKKKTDYFEGFVVNRVRGRVSLYCMKPRPCSTAMSGLLLGWRVNRIIKSTAAAVSASGAKASSKTLRGAALA